MAAGIGFLTAGLVLVPIYILLLKMHGLVPPKSIKLAPELIEHDEFNGKKKFSDPKIVWAGNFEEHRRSWNGEYKSMMYGLLWFMPAVMSVMFGIGAGCLAYDFWPPETQVETFSEEPVAEEPQIVDTVEQQRN